MEKEELKVRDTKKKMVGRKPITRAEMKAKRAEMERSSHSNGFSEEESQHAGKYGEISWEGFPTRVHQIKEGTYSGKIVNATIEKEENVITITANTEEEGEFSKSYQVEYYGDTHKIKTNTPLYYFLSAMGAICISGKIEWKILGGRKVDIVVKSNQYGTYVQSIKPYRKKESEERESLSEEDSFDDDFYEEDDE